MTRKEKEKNQSLEALHEILKPGDKLQTILRHVSRSGMQREISVTYNGQLLDWHVSRALNMRRGKHDGLVIGGCGMDMGFSIVYNLGSAMWPNGTPKPHGRRNGEPDSNGGYALKQEWL